MVYMPTIEDTPNTVSRKRRRKMENAVPTQA